VVNVNIVAIVNKDAGEFEFEKGMYFICVAVTVQLA